jgi:cytochrome c oxidase subunit IV
MAEHHAEHEHHLSIPNYLAVFAALIIGTIVTYIAALYDLDHFGQAIFGPSFHGLNTIIALTIAFIKASIVVWFFMHVKFSSRLVKLSVGAGLFWLAIMFVLTLSDYNSRTGVIINH